VKQLRFLADLYNAMLIFNEVQAGMGLIGAMCAYEHFGVKPDMMCFGKKAQMCGFCLNERIDLHPDNVFKKSGRINSTLGGNIVDMVRAMAIIKAIKDEKLVENARVVGEHFLERLKHLDGNGVSNVRGKGLMIALDCPNTTYQNNLMAKLQINMLVLKRGSQSIKFRPALTFSKDDVDTAIGFVKEALF
jgi:L-lysine 6-transaminase